MCHFVELLASQNTWRQTFVDINTNIYRGYIYFEGSRGTDIQGNVIIILSDAYLLLAVWSNLLFREKYIPTLLLQLCKMNQVNSSLLPLFNTGDFAIDDVALYRVPCSQVTNLVFVSPFVHFTFYQLTKYNMKEIGFYFDTERTKIVFIKTTISTVFSDEILCNF